MEGGKGRAGLAEDGLGEFGTVWLSKSQWWRWVEQMMRRG